MNFLILSAGTRNKVVQYFSRENGVEVVATDCSPLGPALYDANRRYIVPKITEEGYLETILDICEKESIAGVLSLIDPELTLLAEHREEFLNLGTTPLVSPLAAVNKSFDKFEMYRFLTANGFNAAKSYVDRQEFLDDLNSGRARFPVFVKPVTGSASIGINKVTSVEELDVLWNSFDNLMIQEFLDGTEYGADMYIDMISGEPVTLFVKQKIKMRAGETDKSVSVKSEKIRTVLCKFAKLMGYRGIIDIDIFDVGGEIYVSEVNPRFGGGYPHAYECGVNIPRLIINNLEGRVNEPCFDCYDSGVYMMKYSEIKIVRQGEI